MAWTESAETVSESYMSQQVHRGHFMNYSYNSSSVSTLSTEPDSPSLNLNGEPSYIRRGEFPPPYQSHYLNNSFANLRLPRKRKFQQNQCFQLEVPLGTDNNVKIKKEEDKYVFSWKNLPTWAIYFRDQRHRISNFSVKDNKILPDPSLNNRVSLCFEDNSIVQLQIDAVVTSTNETYSAESGVDQLIHNEAGKDLKEACKNLPHCLVGNAEITPAFMLNARHIIHTNGPLSEDPEKLEGCYENCLKLLIQHQLRTIAFPCISTGRKGFVKKPAAEIALASVRKFLETDNNRNKIDRIVFCLHNPKDVLIYLRFMQIYFPV